LRQVMTVKARVSLVRDLPAGWPVNYGRTFVTPGPMRVATLGIGYADGFPRALSGKGASVLIHGARCPVLGRVTMDQIVVDISHLPGTIVPGEEAVVCGTQGRETISASELAQRAGTIAWEILTGISSRVKRVPVFV
ncbi:MAG TPA: alanine racemase C-terminal domain-containing protein, partial [Verrucomicrobiales bacterium]|nr:alanine racemase C-terminal domain-containing protein [Verrucomicrobiales bacterium]